MNGVKWLVVGKSPETLSFLGPACQFGSSSVNSWDSSRILFIRLLFNDVVNSSDCKALNDAMIEE
jgi:hypothetical protein